MFELKKVQLTKYGGLEISYTKGDGTVAQGEQENPVEYKIKSISAPHPDLVNIFPGFVSPLFEIFHIVEDEQAFDRTKVTGIEFAAGESIIIHWEWLSLNGAVTKLVSPRIKLGDNVWGFESRLQDAAEKLTNEVDAYLNGKRAQLSLFGADGEIEDMYNEGIAELEAEE